MNGAWNVAVSGNYTYVASADLNGLAVVDITTPSYATLAGQLLDSTNMNGA